MIDRAVANAVLGEVVELIARLETSSLAVPRDRWLTRLLRRLPRPDRRGATLARAGTAGGGRPRDVQPAADESRHERQSSLAHA